MMEIVKDEETSATVAPTFDPSKKYKWTPETTFTMNGQQFAIVLNSIRGILSTDLAQSLFASQGAADALENLLKSAVEDGRAIEMED
jgi:hypothetical protein